MRKIIIVITIILIIIMLGIGGYVIVNRKNQPDLVDLADELNNLSDSQLPSTSNNQIITEIEVAPVPKIITETERQQTDIKNRTKFFVEMLGSYSAEARFQNIIDLKPMMTYDMKAWADDFVARNLPVIEKNQERVTTKVFKIETISYSTRQTKVLVYTRRDKTNQSGHKLYNQEAEVELIKVNNAWLINKVIWK